MKQTLLMAAMALFAGTLLAQAEPGGQDGPLTPITASVADSETDAQTDIEAFLKDKDKNGFGAPINAGVNKKDDGSVFVVSTGIGIVAAPITHPSFGASRARAFDRAMLDAKADMARTVAVALETSAQIRFRQYGESDPAADPNVALAEAMAKMPPDTLGGKMMLLLNKKLDNLLKEEGYDIDAARAEGNEAQAAAAAKKVIGEEEFSVARPGLRPPPSSAGFRPITPWSASSRSASRLASWPSGAPNWRNWPMRWSPGGRLLRSPANRSRSGSLPIGPNS